MIASLALLNSLMEFSNPEPDPEFGVKPSRQNQD
jgi:hypothetical protein